MEGLQNPPLDEYNHAIHGFGSDDTAPPSTSAHPRVVQLESCYIIRYLPCELRIAIYNYCYDDPVYTPPYLRRGFRHTSGAGFYIPAIAQTCLQIRHEVLHCYFGDRRVKAELSDSIDNDTVFFERWLRDMGQNLRLIRKLEIVHTVEIFLEGGCLGPYCGYRFLTLAAAERRSGSSDPPPRRTMRLPITTTTQFTVNIDGTVTAQCQFLTTHGDELGNGSVCRCPLDLRIRNDQIAVPKDTLDCELTRAVYQFLNLMDEESTENYMPKHTCGFHNYNLCNLCGGKAWRLQGPKSEAAKAELGLTRNQVIHQGVVWNLCPKEPTPPRRPMDPDLAARVDEFMKKKREAAVESRRLAQEERRQAAIMQARLR